MYKRRTIHASTFMAQAMHQSSANKITFDILKQSVFFCTEILKNG